jgi:hypothetical protein
MPFDSEGKSIAQIVYQNEQIWRTDEEQRADFSQG